MSALTDAILASRMQALEERIASNRALMPATAEIVDESREIFGAGVTLNWAQENGKTYRANRMNRNPVYSAFVSYELRETKQEQAVRIALGKPRRVSAFIVERY